MMGFVVPDDARRLGSVIDPATGETVEVYATPVDTSLPYRKSDGSSGRMRSAESDAALPSGGLWEVYTSNGRMFGENYFDHHGWWANTDIRYLPLVRRQGRVLRFLTQLTVGLSNGFPWRDVLAFASGWSLRSYRKSLRPRHTQENR